MPPIAAVVATRNRPRLLAERSPAFIAAQTWLPDRLLAADDSDPNLHPANREAVARFGWRNAIATATFRAPNAPADALGDFVRRIRKVYNYARLAEYRKAALDGDSETAVAAYFRDLPSVTARYRANTPPPRVRCGGRRRRSSRRSFRMATSPPLSGQGFVVTRRLVNRSRRPSV